MRKKTPHNTTLAPVRAIIREARALLDIFERTKDKPKEQNETKQTSQDRRTNDEAAPMSGLLDAE